MKIAVMGYAGSGKTYLCTQLSAILDIPTVQLDQICFDKNWMPVERAVALPKVASVLDQERWLIDGLYTDVLMEQRLEKADKIVLLLLPRLTCLLRAVLRSRSRARDGYRNDLNLRFLKFTLFDCRNNERRQIYHDIAEKYKDKTVVLKSTRQVNAFIKSF